MTAGIVLQELPTAAGVVCDIAIPQAPVLPEAGKKWDRL